MKEIEVRGTIVNNDDKEIYEWFNIEAVCPKDIESNLKEAAGEDVTLLVSSGGGDLMAGNEIYAALKRYTGKTTAEITGFAASAATIICCGADVVRAYPGAQYMIHNVSTMHYGDTRAMKDIASVLKTADIGIANIYRLKTKLDEKEILRMMSQGENNNGKWMDAKEAYELGFVDEIIGDNGNAPITIYNRLFTTVLDEKTLSRAREMLANKAASVPWKGRAELALLKLKGEVRNV